MKSNQMFSTILQSKWETINDHDDAMKIITKLCWHNWSSKNQLEESYTSELMRRNNNNNLTKVIPIERIVVVLLSINYEWLSFFNISNHEDRNKTTTIFITGGLEVFDELYAFPPHQHTYITISNTMHDNYWSFELTKSKNNITTMAII